MKNLLLSVSLLLLCTANVVSASDDVAHPPYPEKGLKGMVTPKRLPAPEHPVLQLGAEVWGGNCKVCHGGGLAGAPKITGIKFWKPRIAKGLETLIGHALNGFQNTDGGYMPARGGNDALSDKEVEAAVRFMIFNSGGSSIALQGL